MLQTSCSMCGGAVRVLPHLAGSGFDEVCSRCDRILNCCSAPADITPGHHAVRTVAEFVRVGRSTATGQRVASG
ncbi:MAG: hypothetical protein HYX51_00105 [Chloroflexi bacterium]|nr:hypothetical protein [Chloroflexota bacterium]